MKIVALTTLGGATALKLNMYDQLVQEVNTLQKELKADNEKEQKSCSEFVNRKTSFIGTKKGEVSAANDSHDKAIADAENFARAAKNHATAAVKAAHRESTAKSNQNAMTKAWNMFDRDAQNFMTIRQKALADGARAEKTICDQSQDAGKSATGANGAMTQLCDIVSDVLSKIQQAHDDKLNEHNNHKNAHANGQQTQSAYEDQAEKTKTLEKKTSMDKGAASGKSKQDADTFASDANRLAAALADAQQALKDKREVCAKALDDYQVSNTAVDLFLEQLNKKEVRKAFDDMAPSGQTANAAVGTTRARNAGVALLQTNVASSDRAKVVKLLAKYEDTQSLLQVAAGGPFDQVIHLIKEMVTKLKGTINGSEDEHAKCLSSLSENEGSRNEASTGVQNQRTAFLKAQSSSLAAKAKVAENEEAIQTAQKDRNLAEAQRATETAEFKEYVMNAEAAMKAINFGYDAMISSSLKDGNSQKAFAPVQDLVNVLLSDLQKGKDDEQSQEIQAKDDHKKFLADTEADIKAKQVEIEQKSMLSLNEENNMGRARKKWGARQEELKGALSFYDVLHQNCIQGGVSFEARTAKREQEIADLKEALKVLGEAVMPE